MVYKRKITYSNKFELWEALVKFHIACHKIHLSDHLIKTLSYILELGVDKAEVELVNNNLLTSQEFKNYKTKLKTKGVLIKEGYNNWSLNTPYSTWKFNKEFTTLINCKISESN